MTEIEWFEAEYPEPKNLTWAEMIHNARINAEEEYRKAKPFTPVMYESQIQGMKRLVGDLHNWDHVETWLRSSWEIINDEARIIEMRESWAKIDAMLTQQYYNRINLTGIAPQRSGKTWLGSQIKHVIFDEHLSQDRQVPDVRDLGFTYGPINVNWENGNTTFDDGPAHWSSYPQSDAVQLEKWLQLRSVCRRTSSCGMA